MVHVVSMKESELPGVIEKLLSELGRKKNWLATESGVNRAQFYEFMAGESRLRWDALEKIFAALGRTISIEVQEKSGKPLRRKTPTPPNMPV